MNNDPYDHLHIENYELPFETVVTSADNLIFTGGRSRVNLNGTWRFATDLHDEGLRQKWYLDEPSNPYDLLIPKDHDWGNWRTIPVPSCWNVQAAELKFFEGSCWYTRTFAAPERVAGEHLYLRIGAANYTCRVFINGNCAATHHGGSTPFFVDLSNHALSGDNTLHIQVENRRKASRIPMHHTDWFNYGGLYRDVELFILPKQFIKDFKIQLDNGGQLHTTIQLNAPGSGSATLIIKELDLNESIEIRDGLGTLTTSRSVQLWEPHTPYLYDVELIFNQDRVTDRVGFRTLDIQDKTLLLNGNPIWLRGIGCHEDDAKMGKCTSEDDLRRRFTHVKELGANAARLSHYPHHELAAQIADEVGILLIEEIPVYWAIDFKNPATLADASNQLSELIRRDWNRASVVMWGVGNENADTDERLAFMSALATLARTEDPNRWVTAACLINRERFTIEDRLAEQLDVIGINEYFGWYEPQLDLLKQLMENSEPNRPVYVSETGADAVAGYQGEAGKLFSEEHQRHVLESQIEIVSNTAYMCGIFPWLLYDFRTERRQTEVQQGWNKKGFIDKDKVTKKSVFETVRKLYSKIKENQHTQ